jgi:hypothetical protein
VAQKGRNVAGSALSKSAAYGYFFDKALKTSRRTPTAGLFSRFADRFAHPAQNRIAVSPKSA